MPGWCPGALVAFTKCLVCALVAPGQLAPSARYQGLGCGCPEAASPLARTTCTLDDYRRANMAHVRQSTPDSGFGSSHLQCESSRLIQVVPSPLKLPRGIQPLGAHLLALPSKLGTCKTVKPGFWPCLSAQNPCFLQLFPLHSAVSITQQGTALGQPATLIQWLWQSVACYQRRCRGSHIRQSGPASGPGFQLLRIF